jgi:hypothetical protein
MSLALPSARGCDPVDLSAAVAAVRALAPSLAHDPDNDLAARASALAARHRDDPVRAAVEATALAADATRRVLGVDLHDAQLAAGVAMSGGTTVQLRTGEGKTFAAIAPALLFARVHGFVHVVTANPYLAERDAGWSGRVLTSLGLTVAATLPARPRTETRRAYAADVVFGAGSDFGFDLLRDQLAIPGDGPVQRGRRAAIVDEVDAVLIDEARTPLVLSAPAPVDVEGVRRAAAAVADAGPEHIEVDELHGHVGLTDDGIDAVEQRLGIDDLYAGTHPSDWPQLVVNAVRAKVLLRRDHDYVVRDDGTIGVVDELTGRVLPGRRWADGLQQAVEAKEGVPITADRRAVGRITVGGYFAGYDVVVGMSGTLDGVEDELVAAHRMPSIALPTNAPVRRVDHADLVVRDADARLAAIADDTASRHRRGQPVLLGTVSIAQAHELSQALDQRGVPHRVLTARNDAEEAAIVAAAGRPGAVTVATQMAGRGVDIVLREPDGPGLFVWGVQHHAARRLDLQLRGRAGRQGDPGESRFAHALGDESDHGDDVAGFERLEAELRQVVRVLDGPVDEIHRQVHEWRVEASDPTAALAELDRGVRDASDRAALAAQASVAGPAWPAVVAAVLHDLLVTLWSDTLDQLDTDAAFARGARIFNAHRRVWQRQVETRYAEFRRVVRLALVLQLRSATIVVGADDEPFPPAVAAPRPVASDDEVEDGYDREWTGFSPNRFWRKYFALFPPDPPLVLDVEAIGDEASGRIRVRLDHDDATRSRIAVPRDQRRKSSGDPP